MDTSRAGLKEVSQEESESGAYVLDDDAHDDDDEDHDEDVFIPAPLAPLEVLPSEIDSRFYPAAASCRIVALRYCRRFMIKEHRDRFPKSYYSHRVLLSLLFFHFQLL